MPRNEVLGRTVSRRRFVAAAVFAGPGAALLGACGA
jgi:hypothetical protein